MRRCTNTEQQEFHFLLDLSTYEKPIALNTVFINHCRVLASYVRLHLKTEKILRHLINDRNAMTIKQYEIDSILSHKLLKFNDFDDLVDVWRRKPVDNFMFKVRRQF